MPEKNQTFRSRFNAVINAVLIDANPKVNSCDSLQQTRDDFEKILSSYTADNSIDWIRAGFATGADQCGILPE